MNLPQEEPQRERCSGGYSTKPSCDGRLGDRTEAAPAGIKMPQAGSQQKNKKAEHTLLLASKVLASQLLPAP